MHNIGSLPKQRDIELVRQRVRGQPIGSNLEVPHQISSWLPDPLSQRPHSNANERATRIRCRVKQFSKSWGRYQRILTGSFLAAGELVGLFSLHRGEVFGWCSCRREERETSDSRHRDLVNIALAMRPDTMVVSTDVYSGGVQRTSDPLRDVDTQFPR